MEDAYDYKMLLNAILRQAMDDYVKLQHPKFRKKKYMQEAFNSAVDMFFDSEFRLLHVKNDNGEFMSLKDMVSSILDDDRLQMEKMKEHLVVEARSFWETKMVNTIYIPDSFIYDGHVYSIEHSEEEDIEIDFDLKTITLNKNIKNSENQQRFVESTVKVVCYHEDLAISQANLDKIGKGIFKMLRINSCFSGD
jgi:hypothetical protein